MTNHSLHVGEKYTIQLKGIINSEKSEFQKIF